MNFPNFDDFEVSLLFKNNTKKENFLEEILEKMKCKYNSSIICNFDIMKLPNFSYSINTFFTQKKKKEKKCKEQFWANKVNSTTLDLDLDIVLGFELHLVNFVNS